jgi:glycosyltransferase involved in cell wall biosynthesis
MRPERFDVAHVHWASYGALAFVSRIPVVLHCHGSDVRARLSSAVLGRPLASILRRAAAVLCITPDLLPAVRAVRPDAGFLPAPVDTEQFSPCLEQDRSERPWTVLLFARLDASKGADVSTAGLARFAARHPDVRVRLLDWGDQRERYRALHGERFEFLPRLAPGEVPGLLRAADAVVGQFALGALGLSELQAMSCARPVVASFRHPDAYRSQPPLLDARSAAEVDEALESLLAGPEMAADIGARARRWVVEEHDTGSLARRLETVYREVLAVRPNATARR